MANSWVQIPAPLVIGQVLPESQRLLNRDFLGVEQRRAAPGGQLTHLSLWFCAIKVCAGWGRGMGPGDGFLKAS